MSAGASPGSTLGPVTHSLPIIQHTGRKGGFRIPRHHARGSSGGTLAKPSVTGRKDNSIALKKEVVLEERVRTGNVSQYLNASAAPSDAYLW